ncbi:unnamed protein product, partial [Prorocentrum cordatum]
MGHVAASHSRPSVPRPQPCGWWLVAGLLRSKKKKRRHKHKLLALRAVSLDQRLGPPGGGAAPGALRAPGRGARRRLKKFAQSAKSLCLCRCFLLLLLLVTATGVDARKRPPPVTWDDDRE